MRRRFRSVLVTGGLGFIGSQFVRDAIKLNLFNDITILDSMTYASNLDLREPFQEDRVFIYNFDICSPYVLEMMKHRKIDLIVHFAAESHVTNSIGNPSIFTTTNINGTQNLLECAREAWGKRKDVLFHHVSTDEVYGTAFNVPYTETQRYNPGNPYSASKAGSDHIVSAYGNTYGIPFTISHGCNTFGIYQNEEKFIPLNIKRAVNGLPMLLHAGNHWRQWIPVGFHSFAIWQIIEHGKLGNRYNINLDGNYCIPNVRIIEWILKSLSSEHSIDAVTNVIDDRPGNDSRYWCKSNKLISINKELFDQVINQNLDSFEHQFKHTVKFYVDKFQGEING
jgi:dTDP-glucose 4,6-dehydratase